MLAEPYKCRGGYHPPFKFLKKYTRVIIAIKLYLLFYALVDSVKVNKNDKKIIWKDGTES